MYVEFSSQLRVYLLHLHGLLGESCDGARLLSLLLPNRVFSAESFFNANAVSDFFPLYVLYTPLPFADDDDVEYAEICVANRTT